MVLAKGHWHHDGDAGRCPRGRKKLLIPIYRQATAQSIKGKN